VVSTDAVVLAEADGILRDALTCIQAVMHARPTRTMIRPYSITAALDPSAPNRVTNRFMDQAPTRGAVPRAPETMGGPAPARSPEGGSNLLGRWRGTGSSGVGFRAVLSPAQRSGLVGENGAGCCLGFAVPGIDHLDPASAGPFRCLGCRNRDTRL
jgi:hypothetical protein